MRSFIYFVREALDGFRRNLSTVLGAIVTVFLSLLVIGVFLTLTLVINRLVVEVESQFAISVYLHDNAADEDIWALQTYIGTLPGVSNVTYLTKDEAMARFKETVSEEVANAIPEGAIPATIAVELSDPSRVAEIASDIVSHDLYLRVIDEPDNPEKSIKYGQGTAERLFKLTRIIRYICIGAVALLIFVALIFINNTIRLAIFSRRSEISIMRLVGASNAFIRAPFLMEAAIQSLLGSLLAIFVLRVTFQWVVTNVDLNNSWIVFSFNMIPMDLIYLSLLGAGTVLGLLGSGLAMRRYLRV